ncbi:Plasma membrane low glucose sensor [Marasmius sp. AFHP31]|nr:Plasma membrane low glucose sensor [Marasmius sp. AFHP31]
MAGGPGATGEGIGANAPKNKMAGILMTCFAAFGGILFGYDTGTISGIKVMPDWLRTFGQAPKNPQDPYFITSSEESLIVSILSAGTFFGALLGAPVADILGRKWGVVFACLVFAIGVAMQTAATEKALFVVGRVFAGLGVGLVSCLVPMYQSEWYEPMLSSLSISADSDSPSLWLSAPKWIRGSVVALYQWAITIGILLASIFNNATKNNPNHSAWRIPTSIQLIWGFVLAAGMACLPESPRYLIKKGKTDAAAVSMGRLLGLRPDDPVVHEEIRAIGANLEAERALGESSYIDCFRPGTNKIAFRTWTGIALQAWQQLTGINFIIYYGTTFFERARVGNPFLITIAINVVNVGMTIPGIYGVEKFGRRTLLLWGAVGMCICEFIVGIVGVTVSESNTAGQKVLVAFVCIYIGFFASTWGPIAWVVTGEIFPLQVRAKAMSLSTASNWLWNWALSFASM